MTRLWQSLFSSLDVWPASDPQPRLGKKAEDGHWRVHIPGWAQPLVGSAGRSLSCQCQGISNFLENATLEDVWLTFSPQHTITKEPQLLSLGSDVNTCWQTAVNSFCLVRTDVGMHFWDIFFMFPSLYSPTMPYTATAEKPAFSQLLVFFSMLSFQRNYLGHWSHQLIVKYYK